MAATLARDFMTARPTCCSPDTTLDVVARLMKEHNCGEIPVVNTSGRLVGVITDRDIVCRSVAKGQNPAQQTAESCMSRSVCTVRPDTDIDEVIEMMERHQIRRVPVMDGNGCCEGIISQADLVSVAPAQKTSELLCEISKESARPSA